VGGFLELTSPPTFSCTPTVTGVIKSGWNLRIVYKS
jgi:hypothetical protein